MQVLCGLFDQLSLHIPLCCWGEGGGGGVNLQPNFQTGEWGLDRTFIFLDRVRWERRGRGDLFEGGVGGCIFYVKGILKSEIFNDKKSV